MDYSQELNDKNSPQPELELLDKEEDVIEQVTNVEGNRYGSCKCTLTTNDVSTKLRMAYCIGPDGTDENEFIDHTNLYNAGTLKLSKNNIQKLLDGDCSLIVSVHDEYYITFNVTEE